MIGVQTICGAWLTSCGSDALVASRYLKSADVTASAGGTISIGAADSAAYAGTSLNIPANALPANATITIAASNEVIAARGTAAGPVVALGPTNLIFNAPVSVTIPVIIPSGSSPDALVVGFLTASGARGTISATITRDATALAASNGTATFSVDGLAAFGAYLPDDVTACVDACGVGCAAPGAACYSDGRDYCGACEAACYGATVVTCADAGVDGGSPACSTNADCNVGETCVNAACTNSDVDACISACGVGCAAPGSSCYSDGRDYCSPCTAACSGATAVSCVDGGSSCSTEADCASGEVCVDGVCGVSSSDGGSTCSTDADCGANAVCAGGECIASGGSCGEDIGCPPGMACVNQTCVVTADGGTDGGIDGGIDAGPDDAGVDAGVDGGPGSACRTDSDCASGSACVNNVCVDGADGGASDGGSAPDAGRRRAPSHR